MTAPQRSTVTVLIADDDPLVRLVLRMALESNGYAVLEAVDAHSVVSLADARVDLVVLDINMPGGTVHETLGALRDRHPTVPVLILSGEQAAPNDLLSDNVAFAHKPIELDHLLETVRRLLAHPGAHAS
jgi:DNA-binding NtrC family response regulator